MHYTDQYYSISIADFNTSITMVYKLNIHCDRLRKRRLGPEAFALAPERDVSVVHAKQYYTQPQGPCSLS